MADFDLILRNGQAVTPLGVMKVDLGILEGTIAAIGNNLSGSALAEENVTGLTVFPGFVDAHVHFNEPGRADWEGFATGSRALAAAGGTVFCDMPLNSSPPVIDRAAFQKKREIGEAKSRTDFALWGGLIPGNLDEIEPLADCGAIGLKAFMANSGLEEFPWVRPEELRRGMERAAKVGLLVGVHAESQALLDSLPKPQGMGVREFLDSRPIAAEVEAIRIACELAGETGCQLYIVHVCSPEGVAVVTEARERGVDVTAETCPHYLCFDEEVMIEQGAVAKCAPPLRPMATVTGLWDCVRDGSIHTIGSDHSPAPPDLKTSNTGDFFDAWGGIASCQHAFPAFLSQSTGSLEQSARLLATNPAERFGLSYCKGTLEVGQDADLAIVDFSKANVVEKKDLYYRHPISPYIGQTIDCQIIKTFCRGQLIYDRDHHHHPEPSTYPLCPQFLARQEPS